MTDPESIDAPTAAPLDAAATEIDVELNAEFAAFYQENTKSLVAFLLVQGANLIDATDIVQDTMTAAYRRWRSIEHHRAWAYRVTSRALIRRISTIHEDPVAEPSQPSPLLRDTDIDHWEQHQDIARVISRLPPRQRQIMAWTLFGYTPTEIAGELNITPEAVRSTLLKARRALRTHLAGKEGNR